MRQRGTPFGGSGQGVTGIALLILPYLSLMKADSMVYARWLHLQRKGWLPNRR